MKIISTKEYNYLRAIEVECATAEDNLEAAFEKIDTLTTELMQFKAEKERRSANARKAAMIRHGKSAE